MSETAPTIEKAPVSEIKAEKPSFQPESAESQSRAEQLQQVQAEQARTVIETSAQPQPLALPIDDKPADNQWLAIDKVAKVLRRKQSLKQVQSKLPAGERALSKVVHQPLVKALSETSAKTITRPSGMLGGGIMAFVGSVLYLYLAKHLGFTYNYLLFAVFFVGGFAVGLLFELIVRALHPSKSA